MSRIELGGYGPPIPLPEDGLESLDPDNPNRQPLLINLPDGAIFKQADYSSFGYTHYEVVVIAGAGGMGGKAQGAWGGAGGGGGLHVVHGLLEDLPAEVLVTVGQVGAKGVDSSDTPLYIAAQQPFLTNGNHQAAFWDDANPPGHPYDDAFGNPVFPYEKFSTEPYVLLPNVPLAEAQTWGVFIVNEAFGTPYVAAADGADGGHSAFGEIAEASGGKGGKKAPQVKPVQWGTVYAPDSDGVLQTRIAPGGEGGQGGVGGTTVAGGGADGAKYPTEMVEDNPPQEYTQEWENLRVLYEAKNGTWDGTIGQGGGGGRGGSLRKVG
jgi:hypothetical protein